MIGHCVCVLFSDGSSKTKEGLPGYCLVTCSCAVSQLEHVSREIHDGNITVSDLEKIKARKEQMKRLCGAAQQAEKSKDSSDLYHFVLMRLEELDEYHQQKIYLEHVCQRMNKTVDGKRIIIIKDIIARCHVVPLMWVTVYLSHIASQTAISNHALHISHMCTAMKTSYVSVNRFMSSKITYSYNISLHYMSKLLQVCVNIRLCHGLNMLLMHRRRAYTVLGGYGPPSFFRASAQYSENHFESIDGSVLWRRVVGTCLA